MTEGSLGSGRRWCKHEVGSVILRNFFFEISSLQEARVVRFAAVNINIYIIPLEKLVFSFHLQTVRVCVCVTV